MIGFGGVWSWKASSARTTNQQSRGVDAAAPISELPRSLGPKTNRSVTGGMSSTSPNRPRWLAEWNCWQSVVRIWAGRRWIGLLGLDDLYDGHLDEPARKD